MNQFAVDLNQDMAFSILRTAVCKFVYPVINWFIISRSNTSWLDDLGQLGPLIVQCSTEIMASDRLIFINFKWNFYRILWWNKWKLSDWTDHIHWFY